MKEEAIIAVYFLITWGLQFFYSMHLRRHSETIISNVFISFLLVLSIAAFISGVMLLLVMIPFFIVGPQFFPSDTFSNPTSEGELVASSSAFFHIFGLSYACIASLISTIILKRLSNKESVISELNTNDIS